MEIRKPLPALRTLEEPALASGSEGRSELSKEEVERVMRSFRAR